MASGVRVIDKGWERIQEELKKIHGSTVKVGYPEEKAKDHEGGIDVAALATIHEYGTEHIPPRPFMTQAYDKNRTKINNLIQKEYSSILEGKSTVHDSLQKIGVFGVGTIKEIFRSGKFEPNKPATKKRKKSSQPLIDNGDLRKFSDFEIVEGGK
jgi:tRNA A37 methylthiotransferase MiaB